MHHFILKKTTLPFHISFSIFSIGILSFGAILFISKDILVPLVYATVFAIVLHPIVCFLERKKCNKFWAISLVMSAVSIVTGLVIFFFYMQLNAFSDSLPYVLASLEKSFHTCANWVSHYFNIRTYKFNAFISNTIIDISNAFKSSIGGTLAALTDLVVVFFLIPVYVFLILYYHPVIMGFIRKIFGANNINNTNEILNSSKVIIQKYLIGILYEALIVSALNAIGFLIIGIEYAVLLGVLGALLNIIPYLGGLIAVFIFVLIALVTKPTIISAVWVLVLFLGVQFVDNNLIMPKVVGSQVKINALASIVVVLVGGALWGISGMFLSIPIVAILKVVCDKVDSLNPWGTLLGE